MDYPTKLFHYTSINNLALILKSKKVKFSRLDHVNDLTEAGTCDMGNVGQYFFVSCWTDIEEESLPFWNMYTDKMSGVRIELSFPILKSDKNGGITFNELIIHDDDKTYLLLSDNYSLKKIFYDNNMDNLNPNFWIPDNEGLDALDINENIGILKHEMWEFESEWRYIVMVIPTERAKIMDDTLSDKYVITGGVFSKERKVEINELFFEFNEDTFKNLRLKLGAKCSDAEFIIVEALLKQYNPNAKLEWSDFKGKIK